MLAGGVGDNRIVIDIAVSWHDDNDWVFSETVTCQNCHKHDVIGIITRAC